MKHQIESINPINLAPFPGSIELSRSVEFILDKLPIGIQRRSMAIIIKNARSFENDGDGIRIDSNLDVMLENIETFKNSGQGISIVQPASLIEQIGLPKDTNPKELAELLRVLQQIDSNLRPQTIQESGLLKKLGAGALNFSTITANILTIASNPNVQGFIDSLNQ